MFCILELGFVTQIWALPLASVVLVAFGVLISLVITGGTGRLPFFMGSFSFHNQVRFAAGLV